MRISQLPVVALLDAREILELFYTTSERFRRRFEPRDGNRLPIYAASFNIRWTTFFCKLFVASFNTLDEEFWADLNIDEILFT